MKSAWLSDISVNLLGDAMANPKLEGKRMKKRIASVNSTHNKELPATHWAHAVAMLAEKSLPAAQESEKQLPEDSSATNFDVVRARALSNQI